MMVTETDTVMVKETHSDRQTAIKKVFQADFASVSPVDLFSSLPRLLSEIPRQRMSVNDRSLLLKGVHFDDEHVSQVNTAMSKTSF